MVISRSSSPIQGQQAPQYPLPGHRLTCVRYGQCAPSLSRERLTGLFRATKQHAVGALTRILPTWPLFMTLQLLPLRKTTSNASTGICSMNPVKVKGNALV